jgi:hypothetical protein
MGAWGALGNENGTFNRTDGGLAIVAVGFLLPSSSSSFLLLVSAEWKVTMREGHTPTYCLYLHVEEYAR